MTRVEEVSALVRFVDRRKIPDSCAQFAEQAAKTALLQSVQDPTQLDDSEGVFNKFRWYKEGGRKITVLKDGKRYEWDPKRNIGYIMETTDDIRKYDPNKNHHYCGHYASVGVLVTSILYSQNGPKKIGEEMVNGIQCDKYLRIGRNPKEDARYGSWDTNWLSQADRFPVKAHRIDLRLNVERTSTHQWEIPSRSPEIPDELFEIPSYVRFVNSRNEFYRIRGEMDTEEAKRKFEAEKKAKKR